MMRIRCAGGAVPWPFFIRRTHRSLLAVLFLLFLRGPVCSLPTSTCSRQKYNEYVLCLKKNGGDEDECKKAKQFAYSICPDDWVRFVAIIFYARHFFTLTPTFPLSSPHADVRMGGATRQWQLLGHPGERACRGRAPLKKNHFFVCVCLLTRCEPERGRIDVARRRCGSWKKAAIFKI